ncbi:MAG: tyrosine-type recombinase/integrase, partial [bacterium]
MNHSRYQGPLAANGSAICLAGLDWPQLWACVQGPLRAEGYSTGTIKTYRHVLRSFSRWFYSTPERVTARAVKAYILALTDRHCSWSWTSTNISVLRAVFDHLGGMSVCATLVTPKRPQHLPHTIGRPDILRILAAADTPRDQLLLGLLYGCGLKVAEACSLKWADVDAAKGELRVGTGRTARTVAIPSRLLPLLARGVAICDAADHVFRGNRAGVHLSPRMAEYVLRKAAKVAGIGQPVCCMTL